MSAKPKIRWWWPHGQVDPIQITTEVNEMYAAGFGGAEIEDVHPSIKVSVDPVGHGWATAPWINAVEAASERADYLGFQIDIALGPSYPASVPSLRPDDEGAEKEVVSGRVVVSNGSTYDGPVPAPYVAAESGVFNQSLLAVQAWRMDPSSKITAVPLILDSTTLVDLTRKVVGGTISWSPPDNGTWVIISYRMRGTGQLPEAGPHNDPDGAVIDHFSTAGSMESINYWNAHVLSSKLRALFQRIRGSIFEDSIELEYNTLWTPNLADEFKHRNGYDILSVLPTIVLENQKQAFSFTDSELARGVKNDYWDTMGDLYISKHADPIRKWANSLGMELRSQPYGLPTDAMGAMAAVNIPEGESLSFKNLGDYRSLAGAANMAGLRLLSNEACAFAGGAYSTTWQLVLQTLNPIFTAGINHNVLHGFAYNEAPRAAWPGFAAFTPYNGGIGYAEAWGPRSPLWVHATDITGYIARMQLILQRGTARHDVAFFSQKGYVGAGYNTPWFSAEGTMVGWSLNIIGPSLLKLPSAVVKNRQLAPSGPAYKILAFEGDSFASKQSVITLDSATRILQYAQQGLPVLVIGNWSTVSAYGRRETSQNSEITALLSRLLKLSNVVNVPTEADIPTGVTTLGIQPSVKYNSSQLINLHRVDGDLDHFLFVASTPTAFAVSTKVKTFGVDADVILPRRFPNAVPVLMNLWTGEMTPLGLYTELSSSQIKIHISLQAYQATMITLVVLPGLQHATSTTADKVYRGINGLILRSNKTGSFSTTLSSGRKLQTQIGPTPPVQELTKWTLDVQDYRPGTTNSSTTIIQHHINLEPLTPWTNITELADVSGIGTYKTSFSLKDWPADAGATLQLPSSQGSFRLKVNGKALPSVDQLAVEFDIGDWLRSGSNTLEVELATTLLNRLRVSDPAVYGIAARQSFGLVGPVLIVPYREKVIAL